MVSRCRPRLVASLAFTLLLAIGCGQEDGGEYSATESNGSEPASVNVPVLSDTARLGETLFNAHCSECHGAYAAGSSQGPPLGLDKIYEPGHHGDFSFHLAVRQGVKQHHWGFGDMDPVSGVSEEDVDKIVCFVREIQYANGVFKDPAALSACQSE